MKKLFAASLAIFAGLSFSAFAFEKSIADNEKVEKVEAITSIASTKGKKIYVVGDSTFSSFSDPYYYPRYGIGTKLQDYLNPKKVEVINLAMSGRSSKSFLTEANSATDLSQPLIFVLSRRCFNSRFTDSISSILTISSSVIITPWEFLNKKMVPTDQRHKHSVGNDFQEVKKVFIDKYRV